MNTTRRRICAAFLLTALPSAAQAESTILTIGLLPYLPARELLELYQPLATFLKHQLGVQVKLFSAKNFREFYQATLNNQFDVVVTAPNLAWLAMSESGYRPIARFINQIKGVVITKRSNNIIDPENCRGKIIATADSLSIVNQLGIAYLKSFGLTANVDYQIVAFNNHTNAAWAVMIDKVDCAVVAQLPFQQMSAKAHAQLRVFGETASVPSQFIMANSHLSAELSDQLLTSLIEFNHAQTGETFLHSYHAGEIAAAEPSALSPLQPYALTTKSLLNQEGG